MVENNDPAEHEYHADPMDVNILGQSIGKASGWDQPDNYAICFNDFVPNELGMKFIRFIKISELGTRPCLWLNFETGVCSITVDEEKEEVLRPDWSVFNK